MLRFSTASSHVVSRRFGRNVILMWSIEGQAWSTLWVGPPARALTDGWTDGRTDGRYGCTEGLLWTFFERQPSCNRHTSILLILIWILSMPLQYNLFASCKEKTSWVPYHTVPYRRVQGWRMCWRHVSMSESEQAQVATAFGVVIGL